MPDQFGFNNNNPDFNTYLNNVSLQLQADHNNNENFIKLNLFHQIANNSSFNFFASNSSSIEANKPYQYNQLESNDNSKPLVYQSNPIETNLISNSNLNMPESVDLAKSKKVKKSRILFSQWQINELEKLFKKQKYVTSNERELMAKRLKLQANQVKIWFQNRRYKIKKQNEAQKSE